MSWFCAHPYSKVLDVAEPERGTPTRGAALGDNDKEPITDLTLDAFARAAEAAAAAGVGGGSSGAAEGGAVQVESSYPVA
jgi:hypothetical protein